MKNNRIINVALVTCLLGLSYPAFAEDAPKGWLMARSGAANTDANYGGEDTDINDNLTGVSVLCAATSKDKTAALVATDGTRNWGAGPQWYTASTTTVINLGAKVVKDPLRNNPNHCLINGISRSNIKGIWSLSP